jgi:hypothetical protein
LRRLSEKNGEKRLTEFDAFATAVERIAGFSPTNAFRTKRLSRPSSGVPLCVLRDVEATARGPRPRGERGTSPAHRCHNRTYVQRSRQVLAPPGVYGYLIKPLQLAELLQDIADVTRRHN